MDKLPAILLLPSDQLLPPNRKLLGPSLSVSMDSVIMLLFHRHLRRHPWTAEALVRLNGEGLAREQWFSTVSSGL